MAKPALGTLRAIFREEFDDMLGLLAAQVERAAEEPNAAADELRRAVHTLKGAARAAGFEKLEAECHRLETQAEKLRAAGGSPTEIVRATNEALGALSRFAPEVHAGAVAPSPPSLEPRRLEPPVPAAPAADTMRVDATALERILHASEDLVLEMSRGVSRSAGRALDSGMADVLRELEYLRSLAAALEERTASQAAGELRRRLERVTGTTRTALAMTEARETSEESAWRLSADRAKAVASAARGLRQERFESLAITAVKAAEEAANHVGVRLQILREGDDVRFDRRLREPLREILLHLVRNAVAHGFAGMGEGLIRIRAEEGEGELRVLVADNGRGIDRAAVAAKAKELGFTADPMEAVFAPGVSTRTSTDELAGRGIGLDVVRQRVIDLHGRISVESEPGRGTTFRIAVAPDLSLTRALVARTAEHVIAIRLSGVERILRILREDVRLVGGRSHVLHRGALLPLASVAAELGASTSVLPEGSAFTAIVTGAGERRVALIVEEIIDEREVAVRPLSGRIRSIPFVTGTSILADGMLAWMLDVSALAVVAQGAALGEETTRMRARRVLVVDDSATTRELERALLRANGFEVEVAADGEQGWLSLASRPTDTMFDIVLSDVEMPRLDGFALLGRIRSTPRFARLPVVLVTALEDPADKQRALDMGASAYIVKSAFDEEQLLDVIANLL